MALDFKLPADVGQEYLDELKTLKPSLNTDQTDNDWFIRSQVVGGVISGIYADQRLISNDAFPQRARHDALQKFLELYFEGAEADFLPSTQGQGEVIFTGTISSSVPAGTQVLYSPNGNAYQVTNTTVLSATAQAINVESVAAGQDQNLSPGAPLTVQSPPAGINSTATVGPNGISDARDPETDTEARDRILARIRNPLSVGRVSDYIQYAEAADPSVTGASVLRYPFGLGTVAVYITSGTTDIDSAIDNGTPISLIPSDALIDTVQAYLEDNKPVTDCVTVLKPSALSLNVTVQVRYKQGDGSTILSGQTLTQAQLVTREIQRAIYKMGVGGRMFDSINYAVKSDIEENLDNKLSAEPNTAGEIPILSDRYVHDLSATGVNRMILSSEVPIPGTITIMTF